MARAGKHKRSRWPRYRDGERERERALVCVGERSHGDDKREREENGDGEGTSFSPNPDDDFDPPFDSRAESLEREMAVNRSATNREGQFKKPPPGKGFSDPFALRNVALNVESTLTDWRDAGGRGSCIYERNTSACSRKEGRREERKICGEIDSRVRRSEYRNDRIDV